MHFIASKWQAVEKYAARTEGMPPQAGKMVKSPGTVLAFYQQPRTKATIYHSVQLKS